MGDNATNVIFYQAYWYLAFKRGDDWIDARTFGVICGIGAPERSIELR